MICQECHSTNAPDAKKCINCGASLVESLLRVLRAKDHTEQLAAARALDEMDDSSTELLSNVLKEIQYRDLGTASRVAETLGRVGGKRAIEPLILALRLPAGARRRRDHFDETFSLRQAAARSLRSIEHPDALEALIRCLQDDNPIVREHAADALGMIDERINDAEFRARVVKALTSVLDDSFQAFEPHYEVGLDHEAVWPVKSAAVKSLFSIEQWVKEHSASASG